LLIAILSSLNLRPEFEILGLKRGPTADALSGEADDWQGRWILRRARQASRPYSTNCEDAGTDFFGQIQFEVCAQLQSADSSAPAPNILQEVISDRLSPMSLKTTASIVVWLVAALTVALAQDQGRRSELESSLQSRYRLTVVGGGLMGMRGENSIRRAGGVVVLMQDGLYGAYNRPGIASNSIKDGKAELLSGDKDVVLARGEKFYVTAAYVGSDVVTLGLLSARMIPGGTKTAQVWCTANFFFTKDTLAQGDIGKVYSVIDQWLLPEGAVSAPVAAAPPPAAAPAPAPTSAAPAPAARVATPISKPVDLKPGMTRDEVVSALGAPLEDTGFANQRWLTYPGLTITLEQGRVTSVERNAQALAPVKISSDPDGADVFLDGSFVSSTPAVLRLPSGTYKIAVKMSGYTDWVRELKVLPGAEVSLNAKLTK
jgi:hypothetical protein